jgi:DNA repair protein RecN (Recombination protein N)
MLSSLSIRDVVLIERLDLSFEAGLTVLTGETGAGKSILLDSLGLALGARSEAGLVRTGCAQASVAAVFTPTPDHPATALLAEQGITSDGDIVLRRVVTKDGRSRAFVNDQPVGAALLKRVGAMLVEVQGQGDQMGLADPAVHAGLLDAYGVNRDLREKVTSRYRGWRQASLALSDAEAAISAARRDEEWLRHATDELNTLAPQPGEEERMATERHRLQQGERRAEAIAAAISELTPRDRRSAGPASALRAASRALQRLTPGAGPDADNPATPAMAALERAEEALSEAETLLARLADAAHADPRLLEAAEERLFALRGAARKYNVLVGDLPAHLAELRHRLAALDTGSAEIEALRHKADAARADFVASAKALTEARVSAATLLEAAIGAELPPLKLDRARFVAEIGSLPEQGWSASGADSVRFLISTNPGQSPGPLAKIASGGELSRLMLALKVVLAGGSTVPTLVFDEVDSGIGGATAAAVGERLARVADGVQVLLVTHSPQVAARGTQHLRVAKSLLDGRAETRVEPLEGRERREEIARMLAGETVTDAARAAADSLMGMA